MIAPQEIAERALAQAGGAEVAVIVSHESVVNLRWAANTTTTNGMSAGTQVTVVALDRGSATVSGQIQAVEDVADLVARARRAAADAEPAADRAPLPQAAESPDWSAAPGLTSPDVLAPLARGLGTQFSAATAEEHSGYAEHDVTTTYLATTAGTRLRHEQVQGRAEFTLKSGDRTRSAWEGDADPGLTVDVAAVTARLRAGLAHQARPVAVGPGRQTVILTPSATADLMVDLYFAADARAALDGRSVFSGPAGPRLGEFLGAGVRLASDPADPEPGMRCAPFEVVAASSDTASVFDNGLPVGPTDWIADGRLRHLITTRHSAAALGTAATPAVDNLTLQVGHGQGSTADLVARTESGLLVTCLWYNRVVDPQTLLLTGLTRDGVYVVRDGEVVGAAGNFRFNESPVSLLGRIVGASEPERTLAREMGDYFNRTRMPALAVADFNLSTASEAH